jgi:transcriptional regulator with XRE-family HTH domain
MPNAGHDMGIGGRVRAARQRRGWSREALAFHAGISWSAITQLETGRRRNLRPSTLAGLAGALGVTVDYLVSGNAVKSQMLEHHALLYDSDADFAAAGARFLSEAVEGSEAALAVTTGPHCELLREHLDDAEPRVEFADQATWCATPSGALSRLRTFVDGHVDAGRAWVRVLVEPVTADRPVADARLWARYEALLNVVFRSTPITVVCAYDAVALDANVLEHLLVTHPHTLGEAEALASSEYLDPLEFVLTPGTGADAGPATGADR